MTDKSSASPRFPSPEDYGSRFEEINTKLGQSLALSEYRGKSNEDTEVLRYRLVKLALAAADITRAIAVLAEGNGDDDMMAEALVELRNACAEVTDSFTDADPRIVRLLNFVSG